MAAGSIKAAQRPLCVLAVSKTGYTEHKTLSDVGVPRPEGVFFEGRNKRVEPIFLKGQWPMKESTWRRMAALLLTLAMSVSLLAGSAGRTAEDEEEPIRVYLWTANLYEKYAPYVQAQLPNVDVEFVVGNNDLDFYKFLNENGGLPDVITCCRFSLHDAQPLKDSLTDLSTSNEAGAVYNTYLFAGRGLQNDRGRVQRGAGV